MSERLLQVDLLDAQARSSRVSMLLPGSLELAETELRCAVGQHCCVARFIAFVAFTKYLRC